MTRAPANAAFLSVPVLLGAGMLLAGLGLFVAIRLGFEAEGPLMRYRFHSSCDGEARVVLMRRLDDYGLPYQMFGANLDLQVQLPGKDDDEAEHFPRALARPGLLEVRVDGAPFPVTVQNAGFQLSVTTGSAVTLLTTAPPVPARAEIDVDGTAVAVESITAEEIQLLTAERTPTAAIREATERAVALRHPLPCPVVLAGSERVER